MLPETSSNKLTSRGGDVLALRTMAAHLAYLDLVDVPLAEINLDGALLRLLGVLCLDDFVWRKNGLDGVGREDGRVGERLPV